MVCTQVEGKQLSLALYMHIFLPTGNEKVGTYYSLSRWS